MEDTVSYQVKLGKGPKYFISRSGNFKNAVESSIDAPIAVRFTLEVAEEIVKRLQPQYPDANVVEACMFHDKSESRPRSDEVVENIDQVWKDSDNIPEPPTVIPPKQAEDDMKRVLSQWGYQK